MNTIWTQQMAKIEKIRMQHAEEFPDLSRQRRRAAREAEARPPSPTCGRAKSRSSASRSQSQGSLHAGSALGSVPGSAPGSVYGGSVRSVPSVRSVASGRYSELDECEY